MLGQGRGLTKTRSIAVQRLEQRVGNFVEAALADVRRTAQIGQRRRVGPDRLSDLRSGHRVQLLIPGNTFHTARLIGEGWFLGASTEWPGVVPADVEIGNLDELCTQYPAVAGDLRAIAGS